MFGFLLLNLLMLIVTISLLSVLSTYLQLCSGHHEWWWRSFYVGMSGGVYMAIYCVLYMLKNMDALDLLSDLSIIVYIVSFLGCYSVAAGAISVQASYIFTKRIYADIRKD